MALLFLWIGTLADVGLLALLVATSGFIFGAGPEGLHGDLVAALVWWTVSAVCVLAPVGGFMLRARGRPNAAALVVWVPVGGALILAGL